MATLRTECIRLTTALHLMVTKQAQIVLTQTDKGPEYFIVPGGRLRAYDARKIIGRDDVIPLQEGLFPGHAQVWGFQPIGASA